MIEYCRLNNDYLRFTFGDSIIKIVHKNDIAKRQPQIFNFQFHIYDRYQPQLFWTANQAGWLSVSCIW
jgi:hypothetical protein